MSSCVINDVNNIIVRQEDCVQKTLLSTEGDHQTGVNVTWVN
jgi:hypothetical protein